jgi:ABC-type multidrug transport system fused ATPase/permease subunit
MFKILLELLSPSERIQGFFLVLWVLIVALMDVAGIASIMPFIAVLTNPELIQTNEYLAMLYDFSGYSDAQEFLFLLGVIVFSLLVISLSLKALTTYIQTRFTLKLEYSLGRRLLFGYLHQPYEWFLNRNS